jgi:hypothetical protein
VIIGPVVGRYAIDATGNSWTYIFYGGFVAQVLSLIALALLYYPPQHPKGVPWKEALPGLDYVGTLLVIPGVCLALVGIINTTYMPASSTRVIAPLVVGLVLLVFFGLWETFSKTRFPLCPPHIFRSHNGREFTVPFVIAFIVTSKSSRALTIRSSPMAFRIDANVVEVTYYSTNIVYPTMINVFWVTETTSRGEQLALSLPGNIGLVFGACLLIAFGDLFRQ